MLPAGADGPISADTQSPARTERLVLSRVTHGGYAMFSGRLAEHAGRIHAAVTASGTTVTDLFGVGPIVAAHLLGHTGDIARFPSAGHYARDNGSAPIEASSGPCP